jgi:hypothetical protein
MHMKRTPALFTLLVAAVAGATAVAQQAALAPAAKVALAGEWAGRIAIDATRGQDVLWRFDLTSSGDLLGFMGPAAAGTAQIPMQNIAYDGQVLSFAVESQSGAFAGTISRGQVTGTWRQGQWRAVNLTRSVTGQPDGSAAVNGPLAIVIGRWEIRQGDRRDGPVTTYLRFAQDVSGALVGFAGSTPDAIDTPLSGVGLEGSTLTFNGSSQGPTVRRFTGDISGDAGAGSVFEGVEARIAMDKTGR